MGGWSIRRQGAERSNGVFRRQADAIAHARELARSSRSELVVHGRDGRIRESDTYGRDPLPPRDRPLDRGDRVTPEGFGSLGGRLRTRRDIDLTKPIYRQVSEEGRKDGRGTRTK